MVIFNKAQKYKYFYLITMISLKFNFIINIYKFFKINYQMFQKTNGKITFNVLNAICFYIDQLNLFLDFYKIIYFFNMFCYILFFFFENS